jgi:hypothetical protein
MTLVALSAAIVLLLASPLALFNILQPVQATTLPPSIQTPNPVALGDNCNVANAQITFNAQGMDGPSPKGAFQITDSSSGKILWSGDFYSATPGDDGSDEEVDLVYNVDNNSLVCGAGSQLWVTTYCTQAPPNPNIILETDVGAMGGVNGAVDCGTAGDTTAQQPSSSSSPMTGTTTQDGDRGSSNRTDSNSGSSSDSNSRDGDSDGIPDSSDNCPHNSYHRCYKEGDTSSTTSTREQQPSSSSGSGNQTR